MTGSTLFDVAGFGAPVHPGEPGVVGADHPATSVRAAASVAAGSQALLLLRLVAGHPEGLTCDEAQPSMSAGRAVPMSPNQVGARMLLLRERHLVDACTTGGKPVTRPTRTGRDAVVHVVTDAGRAELVRHGVQPIRNLERPRRVVRIDDVAAWYCEWCDEWGRGDDELSDLGVHRCGALVSVYVSAVLDTDGEAP